jgi:hypothetical protein
VQCSDLYHLLKTKSDSHATGSNCTGRVCDERLKMRWCQVLTIFNDGGVSLLSSFFPLGLFFSSHQFLKLKSRYVSLCDDKGCVVPGYNHTLDIAAPFPFSSLKNFPSSVPFLILSPKAKLPILPDEISINIPSLSITIPLLLLLLFSSQ